MNLIIGYSGHFIDSFAVVSNQNEKLILKNIKEKYESINHSLMNKGILELPKIRSTKKELGNETGQSHQEERDTTTA